MGYTPVDGLYEYAGLRICQNTLEIFINSGLIPLLFLIAVIVAIYKTARHKTFSKPLLYMLYFWIIYTLFMLPSSTIERQPSLFEEVYPEYKNKDYPDRKVKIPVGMDLVKGCIDKLFAEIGKIILPENLSQNYMHKMRLNLIREAIALSEPALISKVKKFKNACYNEALSRVVVEKKNVSKEALLDPFSQVLQDYYSKIKVASKDSELKPEVRSCKQILSSLVEGVKQYLKNDRIYNNYQKAVLSKIPESKLLDEVARDVISDKVTGKKEYVMHLPEQASSALSLVKDGLTNIKNFANGSFEMIWTAPYVYGVCMAILLTFYPFFVAFALLAPFYRSLLHLLQIYISLKICPIIWFIACAIGATSLPFLALLFIIILSPVLSFLLLGRLFYVTGLGFSIISGKIYGQKNA
jgi:hypothetical protein